MRRTSAATQVDSDGRAPDASRANGEHSQPETIGSLHNSGDPVQTIAACREILSRQPADAKALGQLWKLCLDTGDPAGAVEWLRRAIEADRKNGQFHYMLGCTQEDLGQKGDAIASYRMAMRLDAAHAKAANNLGCLLEAAGDVESAAAMYEAALRRDPALAQALYNLGNLNKQRGDLEKAAGHMARAIGIQPENPDWHANLGEVFELQWQIDQALDCYRAALALDAGNVHGLCGAGSALQKSGRTDQAEAHFREAVRRYPQLPVVHSNLLLCLHYRNGNDAAALYAEHLEWARSFASGVRPRPGHNNDRAPDRRLNLGYVSADFRSHPVANFLERPLAAHDSERFRVFCYSSVASPDATTQRFQEPGHDWRNVHGLSDEETARLIRDDAIDILVDLSGHTGGSRLQVLAAKPAPVQATWLGYPNTTGLTCIDYRLTDEHADPAGTESFHSERLLRLSPGFLCYTPPADAPAVTASPAVEAGHITFGCFNNLAKVTPDIIRLWSGMLAALPKSRFVLKAGALGATSARAWVAEEFRRQGIAPDRYELLAPEPTSSDHLRRYAEIDIALDTFPYHGTTTTCEALWMGVPVVTLAGRTHVSRVGVSLLSRVGLRELITDTPEAYVQKALQLAADPQHLAELRAELRSRLRSSPLLDVAAFTAGLEDAYAAMWREWCLAGRSQA
jgi:predicted O-linked N-acetylglucosamine transferase (SPINDLY family)